MKTRKFFIIQWLLISISSLFFASVLSAETAVEVKLQSYFEENRGWCLDLRGPPQRAQPLGGVHGHTCYLYQGSVSRDQGYAKEDILEKSRFRLAGFPDQCMTIYEPNAGSFVSVETCDDRITQKINLNDVGQIVPAMEPSLCLTISSETMPGGGANPLHILRDVTFEKCDDSIASRQLWELREEWTGLAETTQPRTWEPVPRQRRRNQ